MPCRQRLVARGGLEGVDPDDPVGEAGQALHLLGEHRTSPRSQPSERMTTTAPRAMPRCPQRSTNSLMASPSRVPPEMSSYRACRLL